MGQPMMAGGTVWARCSSSRQMGLDLTFRRSGSSRGRMAEVPVGALYFGNDGAFYGTTVDSTAYGTTGGTAFKIDTSGTLTTIHRFTCTDGGAQRASSREATGASTERQGLPLYAKRPMPHSSGSTLPARLRRFTLSSAQPRAPRARRDSSKVRTGASMERQVRMGDSVIRIDASGNVTTLHVFTGVADGSKPIGSLIEGNDGALYGTTQYGGIGGAGTIFRVDPSSGSESIFHAFTYEEGGAPGELAQWTGRELLRDVVCFSHSGRHCQCSDGPPQLPHRRWP